MHNTDITNEFLGSLISVCYIRVGEGRGEISSFGLRKIEITAIQKVFDLEKDTHMENIGNV